MNSKQYWDIESFILKQYYTHTHISIEKVIVLCSLNMSIASKPQKQTHMNNNDTNVNVLKITFKGQRVMLQCYRICMVFFSFTITDNVHYCHLILSDISVHIQHTMKSNMLDYTIKSYLPPQKHLRMTSEPLSAVTLVFSTLQVGTRSCTGTDKTTHK